MYNVQTCSGYPASMVFYFYQHVTYLKWQYLRKCPIYSRNQTENECGEDVNVNGISLAVNAPIVPLNGVCGPANGTSQSSAPTSGLCSSGTASVVSGTGPWNWSCVGSNGGSTGSCSAPVSVMGVNGVCGPANGTSQSSAPTSGLCSSGTARCFPEPDHGIGAASAATVAQLGHARPRSASWVSTAFVGRQMGAFRPVNRRPICAPAAPPPPFPADYWEARLGLGLASGRAVAQAPAARQFEPANYGRYVTFQLAEFAVSR